MVMESCRARRAQPVSPEGLPVAEFAWSPTDPTVAVLESVELDRPGSLRLVDTDECEAEFLAELPSGGIPHRLSWAPDGTRLAWGVMTFPEDRTNNGSEVRLFNVGDRSQRRVLPVGACQTAAPSWSPDSSTLCFRATPHPFGFQALFGLATCAVQGGMTRYLTHDPMTARSSTWSPNGRGIYFAGRHGGINVEVFSVPAAGGDVRPIASVPGLGEHRDLDISRDGRWLVSDIASPDHLPEAWLIAADGTGARPITNASAKLASVPGLQLGVPELVRWRSSDGLELEGLLLWPPGYGPTNRPQRPLPTVVDIHGGPTNQSVALGLGSHPLFLDGLHHLAANGYLCFSADYRRSGNYGWEHINRRSSTEISLAWTRRTS